MPQKQGGGGDGSQWVCLRLGGLCWDGAAWPGVVHGYLVVAAIGVLLGVYLGELLNFLLKTSLKVRCVTPLFVKVMFGLIAAV